MRTVVLFVLSAGLFVVLARMMLLSSYGTRRAVRAAAVVPAPEPRPRLEVLTTTERLQNAVQRTAPSEKAVAAGANGRAARYEAVLATRRPIANNVVVRALPTRQSDDQPSPAA
jgi:hypothetical protein